MFSYIDNFRLPLARSDGILSGSALDSGCLVGWHNGPVATHAARGWAYLRVAIYRYPFVALDPAVSEDEGVATIATGDAPSR